MKFKTYYLPLFLVSFIVLLATETGCSTSAIGVIAKSEGVLITSVNTGMNVWGDYVRAGHATQSQVDQVKSAYNDYFNAQQLAKAAIEKKMASGSTDTTEVDTANAAVTNAENAVVSLINQFLK